MHNQFKALLPGAVGVSEFVIAVNLDIRGFSSFSMRVESPETAIFLKRVYQRIINEYFPDASFFKPTGDGLLVIIPYSEHNLKEILQVTISKCLTLVEDFPSFTDDDQMINFEVPRALGIGLSRGAACRIESDGRTLDYSGRSLNMATRLMDFARPKGVVFDDSFGFELLISADSERFDKDAVYIKGLAETEPQTIFATKEWTAIPASSRKPIIAEEWVNLTDSWTVAKMMASARFGIPLKVEPLDPDKIMVTFVYDTIRNGKKVAGLETRKPITSSEYERSGGKSNLYLLFQKEAEIIAKKGVKVNRQIRVEITYRKK